MTKTEIEMFLGKLCLKSSQMRSNDLVHNGGWYNREGQKLGWGDLSPRDLMYIAEVLKSDEILIVLGEHDSHWNFVTFADDSKGMPWKLGTEKEHQPLLEYVLLKARWVIVPGEVFKMLTKYDSGVDGELFDTRIWGDQMQGLEARNCSLESLAKRLGIETIDKAKVDEWFRQMEQEQQERRKTFDR